MMMEVYYAIKFLHVLGAIVILGTGAGIAFFMWMAHRTAQPATIACIARIVVVADFVFTASAIIVQPLTGALLIVATETPLAEQWLMMSLGLYVLAGALWIPVVFMQIRMRDLAQAAADTGTPLPDRYFSIYRRWFAFGIPGFGSVLAILWLMIAKPVF